MKTILRILTLLAGLAAIAGVIIEYLSFRDTHNRNREDTQPRFSLSKYQILPKGSSQAYLTLWAVNNGGNATNVTVKVTPSLEVLPSDETTPKCANEFNSKPYSDDSVSGSIGKGQKEVFQVTINIPSSCSVFPDRGIVFGVIFSGKGPLGDGFTDEVNPISVKLQPPGR